MFDSVVIELESAITYAQRSSSLYSDQRDEVVTTLQRALDLVREANKLAGVEIPF